MISTNLLFFMDHKFTQQIRKWLEQPHDERDYSVGALYLLKLSGNQIMYQSDTLRGKFQCTV